MERILDDNESGKYLVIGLAGKRGSGKTTCARHLSELFGLYKKIVSEDAEKNKNIRETSTDSIIKPDQGSSIENLQNITGVNPRDLLQTVGTYIGIDLLSGDFDIDCASREFNLLQKATSMIVIEEVKFDHAAEIVRKNGYMVHLVNTRSDINSEVCCEHKKLNIPSDSQRDFFLSNEGTIEEFKKNISFLLFSIKQKDLKIK